MCGAQALRDINEAQREWECKQQIEDIQSRLDSGAWPANFTLVQDGRSALCKKWTAAILTKSAKHLAYQPLATWTISSCSLGELYITWADE
jgi:hypothetical protein